MSVFTASGGKADWAPGTGAGATNFANIPEIRSWDLTVNKTSKQYASSSTAGGKQRVGGAEDFSGTLTLYIDRTTVGAAFDVDHGIKGGEFGSLKLYESDTSFFVAPAYIENVNYNGLNVEDDSIVAATVSFSRNGALQYPAAAS